MKWIDAKDFHKTPGGCHQDSATSIDWVLVGGYIENVFYFGIGQYSAITKRWEILGNETTTNYYVTHKNLKSEDIQYWCAILEPNEENDK